jgi:hypothetical protein
VHNSAVLLQVVPEMRRRIPPHRAVYISSRGLVRVINVGPYLGTLGAST